MIHGWALLSVTFMLVMVGCALYTYGFEGWAQLLWVLASGTAGAGVVLLFEERR
jgi:hypothetical protein